MLNTVRVLNSRGVDTVLTIGENPDGIAITNIDGLGPVKANLITTPKAQGVGVNYNSKNIESRNIVFNLSLSSEGGVKTIEQMRHEVYDYFPVGEEVELRFESLGIISRIYGLVESVNPAIFAKEPQLQISILCPEPYFVDYPGGRSINLEIENVSEYITYTGRVPTGITVEFTVLSVPPPTLSGHLYLAQDEESRNQGFHIWDFDLARLTRGIIQRFSLGDKILVVTTPGEKKATLTRNGVSYNIIGILKDNLGYNVGEGNWPLLIPNKASAVKYHSTVHGAEHLSVTVSWDVLRDGL